jgi:biotin transport system substrate-specific component
MKRLSIDADDIASPALLAASPVRTLLRFAAIPLFAALTFIGSDIMIPLQPVPMTLQTLFVLLAGAVLGVRAGSLSQFLYVLGGTAGLHIFAGHAFGAGVLAGPTGGYIAGFIVAPVVIGRLISRKDGVRWQSFVFSLGAAVILALGFLHLFLFYIHDFRAALQAGILPFLPGEALKIVAAVSIYRSWKGLEGIVNRTPSPGRAS